jgi:hypothetical protein
LIFYFFPDSGNMVALAQPIMLVSDKSEYRILGTWLDADDHHAGEELVLDREGDDTRIKLPERHPPFLGYRSQRPFVAIEQFRIILSLDQEPLTGWGRDFRRAQFREPRDCSLSRNHDL